MCSCLVLRRGESQQLTGPYEMILCSRTWRPQQSTPNSEWLERARVLWESPERGAEGTMGIALYLSGRPW